MHIYEGIITTTPGGHQVLIAGAAAAALGTAVGLYRLDYERIPRVAVLTAAFFVISMVQVPFFGLSSVHLMLTGLMGLVLGWAIFPAVLVGLVLQTLCHPQLGITTLGINTTIMALPGLVCHYLFRRGVHGRSELLVKLAAFAAGATAIMLGSLLLAGALVAAGKEFATLATAFVAANVVLAVVEGLVTAGVVVLLRKVRPELLDAPLLVPRSQETAHG